MYATDCVVTCLNQLRSDGEKEDKTRTRRTGKKTMSGKKEIK
jgi:hypothetical protein